MIILQCKHDGEGSPFHEDEPQGEQGCLELLFKANFHLKSPPIPILKPRISNIWETQDKCENQHQHFQPLPDTQSVRLC